MLRARGIRQYQETAVHTAGPGKMIAMLYEGAMRFLRLARAALDEGNLPEKNRQINNAQAIISELRHALKPKHDAVLVERLDALYDFVFQENLACQIDNQPGHIENSLRVLQPMHEAWSRIPAHPGHKKAVKPETTRHGPDPATAQAKEDVSAENAETEERNISLSV